MRRYSADRRDTNEPHLINYLRRVGCTVRQLSQKGVPDLLVSGGPLGPFVVLLEVKSESGTLTHDQEIFFKSFGNSFCYVVRGTADIKKVIRQFMVTRTYLCTECGMFDKKERIFTNSLDKCPKCGKLVMRVITQSNEIIFRGDGWGGKNDEKS